MRASGNEKPHVVIVGGGFGGLSAAKALARAPVRVTLLDRTNHHVFQPLLYQVASAGLSPAEIAQPIRSILAAQANVEVLLAEVQSIDLAAKTIALDDGPLSYDFLIVASGAETSYFTHGEWERFAPGLKTLEDALDLRQRILLSFEEAERTPDAEKRKQLLGFVVVGAGPTGVELAGAIAELRRHVLASDFRTFNPRDASVHLVEAGPRLLPAFTASLGASALHQLEELGVEVHLGAKVTGIDATSVLLGDERLPCSVAVWAAGVRAAPLTRTLGAKLDAAGRVEVETDCSIPGHREAFVIGDAMRMLGRDGAPLPGVSQTAMQQARFVAKIIMREIAGSSAERPRFSYYDKGSMATIGRSRAIAQIGTMHLTGFVAWLAWLLVHVWFLIGFRNRIVVMLTWFWSYLTYRRGSRLITGVNVLHMRRAPVGSFVSAKRSASEGAPDRSSPSTRSAPPAPPT
jgi:NADH:ubiquinone reductase (H+-translocating)